MCEIKACVPVLGWSCTSWLLSWLVVRSDIHLCSPAPSSLGDLYYPLQEHHCLRKEPVGNIKLNTRFMFLQPQWSKRSCADVSGCAWLLHPREGQYVKCGLVRKQTNKPLRLMCAHVTLRHATNTVHDNRTVSATECGAWQQHSVCWMQVETAGNCGGRCQANCFLLPGPCGSFAGITAGHCIAANEPAGSACSGCRLLYPIKCFQCFFHPPPSLLAV